MPLCHCYDVTLMDADMVGGAPDISFCHDHLTLIHTCGNEKAIHLRPRVVMNLITRNNKVFNLFMFLYLFGENGSAFKVIIVFRFINRGF